MLQGQRCEIDRIESREYRGVSRVSAEVDGETVWFESADAQLQPSAEALASAFLVPSLHHGVPLRVHAPLSPRWRQNVGHLFGIFHRWWSYPTSLEITSDGDVEMPPPKPESGQCFSGGADSFYSLLRGGYRTNCLIYVHGYDISFRDRLRMRNFLESLDAVAREVGRRAIVLRTNLRKHHLFASVPWEQSHGGALAAIGHLLSHDIGSLVIPSSRTYDDPLPCGSHWNTDSWWSSENMQVIHDDATLYRLNKLKLIDREPLVQQHLRVCWENLAAWGNCSRCDKCVRTMIVLAVRGQLQDYPVFDRWTPLPNILDGMEPVHSNMRCRYQELLDEGMPPEIEAAMRRLLTRDRPVMFSKVRRTVRKFQRAFARLCG